MLPKPMTGIFPVTFPNLPCVYALFYQGEPRWVGQTVSLFSRLHQHYQEREFDMVWWSVCEPDQLNKVESYLIRAVRPTDNRRIEGEGYGPAHAKRISEGMKNKYRYHSPSWVEFQFEQAYREVMAGK